MNLVECKRCGYPKPADEPDDDICIGHVSMAEIYFAMMG